MDNSFQLNEKIFHMSFEINYASIDISSYNGDYETARQDLNTLINVLGHPLVVTETSHGDSQKIYIAKCDRGQMSAPLVEIESLVFWALKVERIQKYHLPDFDKSIKKMVSFVKKCQITPKDMLKVWQELKVAERALYDLSAVNA